MKQWYAVRCKPKREVPVATLLARVDIEPFIPQVTRRNGRANGATLEPLFPNYLFCRIDPEVGELHLVRYTSGVLDILGYGGEPWPVPEDLVQSIQRRLASSRGRDPLAEFQHGDRVVITKGPFRDFEAVFDRPLSATGRVWILVQTLQRLWRAEVRVDHLRLATRSASVAAL